MIFKNIYFLLLAVLLLSNASFVPQAVLQLVRDYYSEQPVVIEVFYNSEKVKILDETLKLLKGAKNIKVTKINADEIDLSELNDDNCKQYPVHFCIQSFEKDAIIIFDTLENYQKLRRKIHFSESLTGNLYNHLVYCEDASKDTLQQIITRDTYESFLITKNGQVSLYTMTMYTELQCRVAQLIEINRFLGSERKWNTEKFFRLRIENFHGCQLRILFLSSANQNKLPFYGMVAVKDSTVIIEGAFMDMIETLASYLNFTFTYDVHWSDKELDIFDFDWWIFATLTIESLHYDAGSPSSYPVCSSSDVFVVPPGELFTSWEKLLMPFDRQTWTWLGIVFAAAFLVILFVKIRKSPSLHEFIIGFNVTTPTLNVVAIFMGIGQLFLPQKIVARFIFINFVLFSLIMRTAYQGKYFEFLTSDMNKKPIQTVEELLVNNFTVIVDEQAAFYLHRLDIFQR